MILGHDRTVGRAVLGIMDRPDLDTMLAEKRAALHDQLELIHIVIVSWGLVMRGVVDEEGQRIPRDHATGSDEVGRRRALVVPLNPVAGDRFIGRRCLEHGSPPWPFSSRMNDGLAVQRT